MTAISYVRRSSNARAGSLDVSFDSQRSAIEALATRHGDSIAHEYEDTAKSGGSTNGRHGYKDMLAAIETGGVTTVYAYALTRLTRNLRDALDLWDLCKTHGAVIRTVDGLDSSTAVGGMQFDLLAMTAKWEREWAQGRVRGAIAERKAKGHLLGSAGYGQRLRGGKAEKEATEDVDAVIGAFRDGNENFAEAARLLNDRGVKPRWADKWSAHTVGNVVRRTLGESVVPKTAGGPKPRRIWPLTGLVHCGWCGGVMTTKLSVVKGHEYPQLFCGAARYDTSHPKPYIYPQSRFMPAVMAEAARYLPDAVVTISGDQQKHTELVARRERLGEMFEMGGLTKDAYAQRLAVVDAELEHTASTERAIESLRLLPNGVDFTQDGAAVNQQLQRLWRSVTLDKTNTKVETVEWRLPAIYWDEAVREAATLAADAEVDAAQRAGGETPRP